MNRTLLRRSWGMCFLLLGMIWSASAQTARFTSTSASISLSSGSAQSSNGLAPAVLYFSIENGPKQVLIRAVGPTLADLGLTNVLADPQITVYNPTTQTLLASNAGWGGSSAIATASALTGALPLDPKAADAALLVTLPTGTWAAAISSVSGGAGKLLGEIYETDQTGRLVYSAVLAQTDTAWGSTSLSTQNSPSVLFRAIGSGLMIPEAAANQGAVTLSAFAQSGTLLNVSSGPADVPNYAIPAATAGDFPVTDASSNVAEVFSPISNQTSLTVSETGGFSGLVEMNLIDSQRTDYAPAILIPPQGTGQYAPGTNLTLSVTALGRPLPTYQWQKDGVDIPGANSRTYSLTSAQVTDSGSYTARITNSLGTVTSPAAAVSFVTIPVISAQPAAVQSITGASATLSVTVSNAAVDSFQWYLNGKAVPGATSQSLTLSSLTSAQAGSYTVTISNSAGSVTSQPAVVTVVDYSRIGNLSILATASAAAPLTVGYTITGATTGSTLPALLRAGGPSLASFNIPNFLPDPNLAVYSGTSVIATNDNWGSNQQSVQAADQLVEAFNFTSATSADAALVEASTPGSYSMVIKGGGASSGLVLAEIYDATPAASVGTSAPRLINVSSLAQIGTANSSLTAGFVILGTAPKAVLIRGVGPTLAQFGVATPAAQIQLTIYNHQGGAIATNSDWGDSTVLSKVFTQVGAFSLLAGSADAAVLLTLNPGSYTATVAPLNGSTGTALVEIYEVP